MTTLLYVEDDDNNAFMLTQRLLRHGICVQHVDTGEKALDAVSGTLPAAVLLDINLPGMDGLSVLRHLRADPRTRSLPVVVVSASVQQEAQAQALDAGANHFLPKPIDFAGLLGLLSSWFVIASIQGGRS